MHRAMCFGAGLWAEPERNGHAMIEFMNTADASFV